MKISKNFDKMKDVYKIFARNEKNLDFSRKALLELYEYETYGKGDLSLAVTPPILAPRGFCPPCKGGG